MVASSQAFQVGTIRQETSTNDPCREVLDAACRQHGISTGMNLAAVDSDCSQAPAQSACDSVEDSSSNGVASEGSRSDTSSSAALQEQDEDTRTRVCY